MGGAGTLYAALNLGHFGRKLHRSDDGGATWTELAAPTFPAVEKPDDKAPSVEMIWTLAAGGADQPGALWAGTLPGGAFPQPRPRPDVGIERGDVEPTQP